MGTFETAKEEIAVTNLPLEEKEKEIRIRVDQAIIDKLKEYKEEIDSGSYGDTLRTLLGIESGVPVVDQAVKRLQRLVNLRVELEKKRKKLDKGLVDSLNGVKGE
jgi:hypothetical protein